MLQVKAFAVNHVQENTFIIHNTKNAILIDPGMYFEKEFLEEIVKTRNNLKYKNIKPSNQKLDMIINIVEELKNS